MPFVKAQVTLTSTLCFREAQKHSTITFTAETVIQMFYNTRSFTPREASSSFSRFWDTVRLEYPISQAYPGIALPSPPGHPRSSAEYRPPSEDSSGKEVPEMLPVLQSLFLKETLPSGHVQKTTGQFVAARQLAT
jgi:hypothetical protein